MNNEGRYILETFIKAGLHPKDGKVVNWPRETIAVCKIDFSDNSKDIHIERNKSGSQHTEEILIEYINEKIKIIEDDLLPKIEIIAIYTNYSPRMVCGGKLMELKQKFPHLQIKFSALYNFRRPSCTASCGCKTADTKAFGMLMELDALPFQKEDWADLINLLVMNDKQKGHPTSDLHGLRFGDYYKDWRNEEDNKMMADYQQLREKTFPSTPSKTTSSTDEPSRPSTGDQATGSAGDVKPRALEF